MCILNRSALGQLNWLMTAIASPRTTAASAEKPHEPKETKIKPAVTLCCCLWWWLQS